MDDQADLAADLLRGTAAIARFAGLPERRAYALLQSGVLPARKELGLWVASKSKLRAHYSESNNTQPSESQR
jgi:hypothetical protein